MPGFGAFGSLSPRMGMRRGGFGGFGGGPFKGDMGGWGGGQANGMAQRFKNDWGQPLGVAQPDIANNPMQGATPNLQPAAQPEWGSQFNGFGGGPGWGDKAMLQPMPVPVADPAAAPSPWGGAQAQQGFGGIDPQLQRLMQMLKQGGGFGGY